MLQIKLNSLLKSVVSRCEAALGHSFSRLTFSFDHAHSVRGLARTIGHQVTLSYEACNLPRPLLEFIVAHELVHVVQKRLLGPLATRDALEREADDVALAILAGRPGQVRRADAADRPAFYEEFGHYYTCYFLLLAAGDDPEKAAVRAFFSQLPDEVIRFDATSATRDYYQPVPGTAGSSLNPIMDAVGKKVGIPRATPPGEFKYHEYTEREIWLHQLVGAELKPREDETAKEHRLRLNLAVTQGLHALTSESAKAETAFRTQAFKENWDDPVISGLAMHPLGDSFSHRMMDNPNVMYGPKRPPPIPMSTHFLLIPALVQYMLTAPRHSGPGIGHAEHNHDPDYVNLRPELYMKNCKTMYDAIRSKTMCGGSFEYGVKPVLERIMRGVTRSDDGHDAEAQLVRAMKQQLRRMGGFDDSYDPENHTGLDWSHFARVHADRLNSKLIGGSEMALLKIQVSALTWLKRRAKVG